MERTRRSFSALAFLAAAAAPAALAGAPAAAPAGFALQHHVDRHPMV